MYAMKSLNTNNLYNIERRKYFRSNGGFKAIVNTEITGEKDAVCENIGLGGAFLCLQFNKLEQPEISFTCLKYEKIHLTVRFKNNSDMINAICIMKWGKELNSQEQNTVKHYGIGVEFIDISPQHKILLDKYLSNNQSDLIISPPNSTVAEKRMHKRIPFKIPAELEFKDPHNNTTINSKVNTIDLSEGGACISLNDYCPNPLTHVNVKIYHVPFGYSINLDAQIVWQNILVGKGYKCGIKFLKLDDGELFILKRILERSITESQLNSEFVEISGQCREFLNKIEDYCERFDRHNPTDKMKTLFVKNEKDEVFIKLNLYANKLQNIANTFSDEEYKRHIEYLRKEIIPYFIRECAILNKQIYDKPLGYAGDFIIANYFYEDGYPGSSSYGKLMDRYTLETPVARAHINRKKYFYKLILETIKRNQEMDTKISSYACGPAIEILDVIRSYIPINTVIFNCIDGEPLSLRQIENDLSRINKEVINNYQVNIINENILKFVKQKKNPHSLTDQHLIYAAGFLDYMPHNISKIIINHLYSLLRKGGRLVIVNISSENPIRVFLESFGEWYLYHRNSDQLLELTEDISDAENIYVEPEPETKMNLFLNILK